MDWIDKILEELAENGWAKRREVGSHIYVSIEDVSPSFATSKTPTYKIRFTIGGAYLWKFSDGIPDRNFIKDSTLFFRDLLFPEDVLLNYEDEVQNGLD